MHVVEWRIPIAALSIGSQTARSCPTESKEIERIERSDRQRGALVGDRARGVSHNHAVSTRIGALDVRDRQCRVGHAAQVSVVEPPLVAQGRNPGGRNMKRRVGKHTGGLIGGGHGDDWLPKAAERSDDKHSRS